MSAGRAMDVGLVNHVVEPGDLIPKAVELASAVAANAPLSVRAGKAMVYQCAGRPREEARILADSIYAPVYESQDALEGPRAFADRREPRWVG